MLVLTLKPEGQNSCEQHLDVGLGDAIQKSSASKTESVHYNSSLFPKSDQNLISPGKITTQTNVKVMRMWEIITMIQEMSLHLNQFSFFNNSESICLVMCKWGGSIYQGFSVGSLCNPTLMVTRMLKISTFLREAVTLHMHQTFWYIFLADTAQCRPEIA